MAGIKIFFTLAVVSLLLSSCESNRWFQSEDKLKSKIQTRWEKVLIPSTLPKEDWIFKEGRVYRLQGTPLDTIDIGNYSVSTTYTKAFLNITDFSLALDQLNGNWEIIELDNGLLFIATDHDGTTGVMQREFVEK